MDKAYITIQQWAGHTETFSTYFECPNCKEREITQEFKFCPMCGISLVFKDGLYEEVQRKDDESMGI